MLICIPSSLLASRFQKILHAGLYMYRMSKTLCFVVLLVLYIYKHWYKLQIFSRHPPDRLWDSMILWLYILNYISCINLCVMTISTAYLFSLWSFLVIALIFACSYLHRRSMHIFSLPLCPQVALFLGHPVR